MCLFTCVDRDTGALFPTLDLEPVLVYKERLQLFLWVEEGQVWRGNREEELILPQHTRPLPGPGDTTLKNLSVQVKPSEYSVLYF